MEEKKKYEKEKEKEIVMAECSVQKMLLQVLLSINRWVFAEIVIIVTKW